MLAWTINPLPTPFDPATYRNLFPGSLPTDRAENNFANNLTSFAPFDAVTGFSASCDDKTIGLGLLKFGISPTDAARVFVAVDTGYRKKGIGRELMRRIEAEAVQHGCNRLYAYTLVTEETLPFAAAFGWQEIYREAVQTLETDDLKQPDSDDAVSAYDTAALSTPQIQAVYETYIDAASYLTDFVSFADFSQNMGTVRPFNRAAILWENDKCIGFAWGQDVEPNAVFHEFTAVRQNYRGKGIATLLKRCLAWEAHQVGRKTLFTANRVGNESILAINRKSGYRVRH